MKPGPDGRTVLLAAAALAAAGVATLPADRTPVMAAGLGRPARAAELPPPPRAPEDLVPEPQALVKDGAASVRSAPRNTPSPASQAQAGGVAADAQGVVAEASRRPRTAGVPIVTSRRAERTAADHPGAVRAGDDPAVTFHSDALRVPSRSTIVAKSLDKAVRPSAARGKSRTSADVRPSAVPAASADQRAVLRGKSAPRPSAGRDRARRSSPPAASSVRRQPRRRAARRPPARPRRRPARDRSRERRLGAPRVFRPLLLSKLLGRRPLRPPSPALEPPSTPDLPRPAAGPRGEELPSASAGLGALDGLDPAALGRRGRPGDGWDGDVWRGPGARGLARDGGWLWLKRDGERWWAFAGGRTELFHDGVWWVKERGVWLVVHDGEPWAWRAFQDWDARGLFHPASGTEMVYSKDFARVAVISPGRGALVYDAATGEETAFVPEERMPARRRPKAPRELSLAPESVFK